MPGRIVVGTFGRGLWITNIAVLREFSQIAQKSDHLFEIQPFAERREVAWGNYRLHGDRNLTTPNEPNGIRIATYFRTAPTEQPSLTVTDAAGNTIRKLRWPAKAGLNRTYWLLDNDQGVPMPAGNYTVTLETERIVAGARPARILSRAPADNPPPRRRPGI